MINERTLLYRHIGLDRIYPHWRSVFYPPELPQSRWYECYARCFKTVEINYSSYRHSLSLADVWEVVQAAPETSKTARPANL
jgi:uncharacterized protein YecE (DUF72 family)